VDLERKMLEGVVQDRVKATPVLVVGKDVPTVIASKDDMVDGSGYVDPFLSRHPESIAGVIKLSMPGPMVGL
jgi:hypothetical protein